MHQIQIADLAVYKPQRRVSNKELEGKINSKSSWIPSGIIEKVFGIQSRRYAEKQEQASDLAYEAAIKIIDSNKDVNIDLMIFASASADLIEPATSNIVQHKLGISCPVMDIKNACNSFVSALQVASGLIGTGQYENILIATGEKPSDSVRFQYEDEKQLKDSFASLSFGDAGSAVLISKSVGEEKIIYQNFMSEGKFWNLCTIKGGGSMFPHQQSMNYFEGKTAELRYTIIDKARTFIAKCFEEAKLSVDEVDHLFTHQVSIDVFNDVVDITGIPIEKCHIVFKEFGNTAAASIPLAMEKAIAAGQLKRGQLILLIGMAAGISISFQLIRY